MAAIGFGFIMPGLLLKASVKTIGLIGLIIIFCHDLTPFIQPVENSIAKTFLLPFFGPGSFPVFSNKVA